ncbi:MAG: 16S rRNA (guanine(966)-N(2))-methyltransferase RsmD [Myxococcota bacterium]
MIRSLRRLRGSASVRRRSALSNPTAAYPKGIRTPFERAFSVSEVTPLRVTGGTLGGRRLRVPKRGVRPTTDRVRESLFAILGDLSDARVLDLYAGTGALGIEALSRGAESVVFIEKALPSLEALRRNLSDRAREPRSRVLRGDVLRGLRRLAGEGARFDLVLADPPYEAPVEDLLVALAGSGLLAPGGTLVLERGRGQTVAAVDGLGLVEHREYGDTVMSRFEASASGGCADETWDT